MWNHNTKTKCMALNSRLKTLFRFVHSNIPVTAHQKLLLYKLLLKPGCIQVYGCTKTSDTKIQAFQSKFLYLVVNASQNDSVSKF